MKITLSEKETTELIEAQLRARGKISDGELVEISISNYSSDFCTIQVSRKKGE